MLDITRRTLALTEQVHDAAGAGGAAAVAQSGPPRTRRKTMRDAFGGHGGGAIRICPPRQALPHLWFVARCRDGIVDPLS